MLTEGNIDRPSYVTDILVSKIISIDRALLITRNDDDIPKRECDMVLSMAERRLRHVPLSYVIGEAEFYGYVLKVGEGCLIPRPETELLAEEMLKLCPGPKRFADWCTGSGCIAIALLLQNENYCGVAVDSSHEALKWAEINRKLYGLDGRLELICSADPLKCGIENGSLDFITANPPYIPEEEIAGLMHDVRDHEPLEALDGGSDGLEVYRMLFAAIPPFLRSGGFVGFETAGDSQCSALADMAPSCLVLKKRIFDYSGVMRHLIWQKL